MYLLLGVSLLALESPSQAGDLSKSLNDVKMALSDKVSDAASSIKDKVKGAASKIKSLVSGSFKSALGGLKKMKEIPSATVDFLSDHEELIQSIVSAGLTAGKLTVDIAANVTTGLLQVMPETSKKTGKIQKLDLAVSALVKPVVDTTYDALK